MLVHQRVPPVLIHRKKMMFQYKPSSYWGTPNRKQHAAMALLQVSCNPIEITNLNHDRNNNL